MEEKPASFILLGVKILLLVISILITTTTVDAHGYLASPRSRNFMAYEDGKWFGGDNTTPFPEPEPQSAKLVEYVPYVGSLRLHVIMTSHPMYTGHH
jgi:predicted carbohydrate-binding protein with CBM5 and CBM33 domain